MLDAFVALLKENTLVFLLAVCSAAAFTEWGFFITDLPAEDLLSFSGFYYFTLQTILVSVVVWVLLEVLDFKFWKSVAMPVACVVSIAFGLIPLAYIGEGFSFNPLVSLAVIMFGVQIMKS